MNVPLGAHGHGHIAHLVALALDAKVHDAFSALIIPDLQSTELFAPDPVKEERGKNRAVAEAFERVLWWGLQQGPRLLVTERRRRPFIMVRLGPLHPLHGVEEDGVFLAEQRLRSSSQPLQSWECKGASLGMCFVHIPMHPWFQPSRTQVEQAPAVLTDPAAHPVFVPCDQGVDRTGLVIAAYRMRVQGWLQQAAVQELYATGFYGILDWLFGWTMVLTLLTDQTFPLQ
jgi:hypothetical protein